MKYNLGSPILAMAALILNITVINPTVVHADGSYTDNFTRADSLILGTNWSDLKHDWAVTGNRAGGRRILADGDGQNALTEFIAPGSLLDTNFILQARITSASSLSFPFIGVAFHIQNSNNYYAFRFRPSDDTIEFVKVVSGTPLVAGFGSTNAGFNLLVNTFYDLKVERTAPGTFNFTLTDGLNTFSRIGSTDATYSLGRAGLYGFLENTGSDTVVADDFILNIVPEPGSCTLIVLALCALSARLGRNLRG